MKTKTKTTPTRRRPTGATGTTTAPRRTLFAAPPHDFLALCLYPGSAVPFPATGDCAKSG